MSHLALYGFGSPRLELEGNPISVHRRKGLALLLFLAISGESFHRDTLAALFWPEEDEKHGRAALRHALSELNIALGGKAIQMQLERVAWSNTNGVWIDVEEFRRCILACQTHHHPPGEDCSECLDVLTEAARLFHGGFMLGFTLKDSPDFDNWQRQQSENLQAEMAYAMERLLLSYQIRGDMNRAVQYAREWMMLEPTNETVHRHLMQLYALSGKRSAALSQYQKCLHILEEEFGVSPSKETEDLYQHICAQADKIDSGGPSARPRQTNAPIHYPGSLPAQVTSFIGRQAEVKAIRKRLARADVRLLTLTGPSGVGKTRLGQQVAFRVQNRYKNGICYVSLAPLRRPHLVASAITQALGISETTSKDLKEILIEALRDRQLLLFLDNFEHLLGAAPLVSDLLKASPGLKVLATSRSPLQIYGEQLFQVPPLPLPDLNHPADIQTLAQVESVHLFTERASAAQPDFRLNSGNAFAIAQICRRLDGLPLALELAASRIRVLQPEEMLRYFGVSKDEFPFSILAHGSRDAPERHQTLKKAIAWSFDLLTPAEQTLFRRLGVFSGGCTLEAIQAICADPDENTSETPESQPGRVTRQEVHNHLYKLVDFNLVNQLEVNGVKRYVMLEMIRAYAVGLLKQSQDQEVLHARHASYYMSLLETSSPSVKRIEEQPPLLYLKQERENLRSILDWSISGSEQATPALGLKVISDLWVLNTPVPFSEQRQWYDSALALAQENPLAWQTWEMRVVEISLLVEAGSAAYWIGEFAAALRYFEQGIARCKELADEVRLCDMLIPYVWTLMAIHELGLSKEYIEFSLHLARKNENPYLIALSLRNQAALTYIQRQYEEAGLLWSECLDVFMSAQEYSWASTIFLNLGQVAQDQDDQERARQLYREGLSMHWKQPLRWATGWGLGKIAQSCAACGQFLQAARLFGAAEAALQLVALRIEPHFQPAYEKYLALTRGGLDPDVFAAAWAEGLAKPVEQSVTEALAVSAA